MSDVKNPTPVIAPPKRSGRHILAVLAIGFVAAAFGLWYWFNKTVEENLKLGAGMELRYKDGLTDLLCDEAEQRHLNIEVTPTHQPAEAVEKVSKHELDAAIIPAGLSLKADYVRHVTMMDCQILHLFVKPEVAAQGLAGLHGRLIFMGREGSGAACVANDVLQFAGLIPGKDFATDTRSYDEMLKSSPDAMPDAVFNLSPLPSPLGEKLVRQFGYQLLELPMGESLALRNPGLEDALIPPDMYGATPAVPKGQLHTIGVRMMMIANKNVSSLAIERLLTVFFESDYARRANIKKMDPALLQRAGDYKFHFGALAFIHRDDPLHLKDVMAKVQGLIGSMISMLSAILLAWGWIRRRKVEVGTFQQECTNLDLDAQRAACQGEFGEPELGSCLTQLAKIKAEVLEQYHAQFMAGDKSVVDLVSRAEELQRLLPNLVRTKVPPRRMQLDLAPPMRKAG